MEVVYKIEYEGGVRERDKVDAFCVVGGRPLSCKTHAILTAARV